MKKFNEFLREYITFAKVHAPLRLKTAFNHSTVDLQKF